MRGLGRDRSRILIIDLKKLRSTEYFIGKMRNMGYFKVIEIIRDNLVKKGNIKLKIQRNTVKIFCFYSIPKLGEELFYSSVDMSTSINIEQGEGRRRVNY